MKKALALALKAKEFLKLVLSEEGQQVGGRERLHPAAARSGQGRAEEAGLTSDEGAHCRRRR